MIKVLHFCLTISNSIFVHLCKKTPCDSKIGPKIEIQKVRIKMRIKMRIKVEKPMIKAERLMIKVQRPRIEVQRLMIEV